MAEYSKHQKKIINNYYDHRDTIMFAKLQEIVTDLYLATAEGTKKRLWQQAAAAMKNLKIKPALIEHIVAQNKAEILAENIRTWLAQSSQPAKKPRGK